MEAYQFYLAIIPGKEVVEYLGKIPDILDIDFHKRIEDFLKNDTDLIQIVIE